MRNIIENIPQEKRGMFYLDQYKLSLKSEGLSHGTIEFYLEYLWSFIRYAKIETPKDFGNHVIIRYGYLSLFEGEKAHISNNTRLKSYNSIKKYSDFLVESEVIESTVITKIKRPKIAKTLPKSLDESQVEKLMSGLMKYNSYNKFYNIRNFVLVEMMIYSGLRRKEVVGLLLSDIKKDFILVRDAKGQKERMIPMPKRLQDTMKGWIELRTKMEGESLFCDHFGKGIEPSSITSLFWRIKNTLGISVHPHLLRHTYASLCIKKGINIYSIQRNMGHQSIETTSIYLNMTDKENLMEIQKLNL